MTNSTTITIDKSIHKNKVRLATWLLMNIYRNLYSLHRHIHIKHSDMDATLEWINTWCMKGYNPYFRGLLSHLRETYLLNADNDTEEESVTTEYNDGGNCHEVTFHVISTKPKADRDEIEMILRYIFETMHLVNKLHFRVAMKSHTLTSLSSKIEEEWDNDFDSKFDSMKRSLSHLMQYPKDKIDSFDVKVALAELEDFFSS